MATKTFTAGSILTARDIARLTDALTREQELNGEMLEALKFMVEFYEDADHDEEAKAFPTGNCPICRAKAVIRKAGGRS